MGHACADVGEKLDDVVLYIRGGESAQEFDKLGADIVASVKEERKKRRQHDTDGLGEGRVDGSGGY